MDRYRLQQQVDHQKQNHNLQHKRKHLFVQRRALDSDKKKKKKKKHLHAEDINIFQRSLLRKILKIAWPKKISNKGLYSKTKTIEWSKKIKKKKKKKKKVLWIVVLCFNHVLLKRIGLLL